MSNAAANPEELPIEDLHIHQTLTPSTSTGSQQSGLIDNTTATSSRLRDTTVSTAGDATENIPELEERRRIIGKSVESRLLKYDTFKFVMNKLQLGTQYRKYRDVSSDTFLDIAKRSLVFKQGKFKRAESQGPYQNKESALLKHFIAIYQDICDAAFQHLKGSCYEQSPYIFDIPQNFVDADCNIRPDGVFCFGSGLRSFSTVHILLELNKTSYAEDIPRDVLGQLGDYAMAVWHEQPFRKFVPVILLHGEELDLFIFTRGKVYRAYIGQFGFTHTSEDELDIADTFERLWFLLTLPTAQFGHLCNVNFRPSGFKILPDSSNNTHVEISTEYKNDCNFLRFEKRIQKSVHIFGRLAYIYRSSYQGKSVVAKISWSPVDRLPECAMYEALKTAGVPGVPEVIDHSFILDDFFGYRAELLLMEDCGVPIGTYFAEPGRFINCRSKREVELAEYTKQVTTSLVRAYDSGILHRDISYGNITIKKKRAYLIDWGYAKFLPWASTGDLTCRWGFGDDIVQHEDMNDSFIGTPLFMSVQILLGATERSIMHDLESLFMVVLHSLASINELPPDSNNPNYGWKFLTNEMTATLRLGCLCSAEKYLEKFGCGNCGEVIKTITDAIC
ncbi:hypothetical protein H4R20_002486 [Coemansia guatemalensis]|uniref:Protein kinase domain-containing protein n=1 Tax=Coemansia guatemalensis TaxID=2761395 RepID=A0A9W8I1D0_9FUNG|nr:hypothetical protein H4R20_002486 [Coemansia guatemalensis]